MYIILCWSLQCATILRPCLQIIPTTVARFTYNTGIISPLVIDNLGSIHTLIHMQTYTLTFWTKEIVASTHLYGLTS